jgi:hypothetical protein
VGVAGARAGLLLVDAAQARCLSRTGAPRSLPGARRYFRAAQDAASGGRAHTRPRWRWRRGGGATAIPTRHRRRAFLLRNGPATTGNSYGAFVLAQSQAASRRDTAIPAGHRTSPRDSAARPKIRWPGRMRSRPPKHAASSESWRQLYLAPFRLHGIMALPALARP